MLVIPNIRPQPPETDADLILVAYRQFKRVYKFDTDDLESYPTVTGIGPYSPEASTREMKSEKASWHWAEGIWFASLATPSPFPKWHDLTDPT
jgi:hypothetical protein